MTSTTLNIPNTGKGDVETGYRKKNATKLSTPPNTLSPRWISLCWKQLWSPKWGEEREKQASSPPPVSFLSNILTAFTQLGSHPCRPSLPPEQPSMKRKNFVRKKNGALFTGQGLGNNLAVFSDLSFLLIWLVFMKCLVAQLAWNLLVLDLR